MNHWLWRQRSRAAFRRLFSTECSQAFETCSCLSFSELHKYKAPCASTLSRKFVWGLICFEHTPGFAKDSRIHYCTSSGAWLRIGSPRSCVGVLRLPVPSGGRGTIRCLPVCHRFHSSFPSGSLTPRRLWPIEEQISLHFLWSIFLLSPPNTKALSLLCSHNKQTQANFSILFTFLSQVFIPKNVLMYHPFQLNNRSNFFFPFLLSQHRIYHNCLLNKRLNSFLTWTCPIQNSHGKLNPNMIILRVGSSAGRTFTREIHDHIKQQKGGS